MCIGIVCKSGCDVMSFEVKFIFLIKLFFLHDQNNQASNTIFFGRLESDFKSHFIQGSPIMGFTVIMQTLI